MSGDSGLQSERTDLAWLRTMLTCWATTLVAMRMALPLGAATVVGPVTVTAAGWMRRRRLKRAGTPPALSKGAAAITAGACLLVALMGALR
jgi:lysylphosphatidylglycerol synthetase-like protein (DUF2156 family)